MTATDTTTKPTGDDLTDEVVLSYLRQRGFGHAAAQLAQVIASEKQQDTETDSTSENKDSSSTLKPIDVKLELEPMEESMRASQHHLGIALGTSGGMGYDLDTGLGIISWGLGGCVPVPVTKSADSSNDRHSTSKSVPNAEARQHIAAYAALQTYVNALPETTDNDDTNKSKCKSELLSVCFPLFVHIYCDLLEMGFVQESRSLFLCWCQFHEKEHGAALRDLIKCDSKEKIIALNQMFVSYNELHTVFRTQQEKTRKMLAHRKLHLEKLRTSGNETAADADLAKIDEHISILKRKEQDATEKIKAVTEELENYPFLKRARSSRWKITLSGETFSMLSSLLGNPSMLPLSNLLQSKCNIDVEERDPLPYVPANVFEDVNAQKPVKRLVFSNNSECSSLDEKITWGVPSQANENLPHTDGRGEEIPFPKYGDPDTFNNSLLLHGFRRLAALETKMKIDEINQRKSKKLEAYVDEVADPFAPSTLMSTCCNIASSMSNLNIEASDIGITCARSSPIDGRRIAIGCEDASVRLWALDGSHRRRKRDSTTVGDARGNTDDAGDAIVLIGHKGGWPVFGVDFCRDGRHLISCGGDGTVRLWDTSVTGPVGSPESKSPKVVASSSPNQRNSSTSAEIKGAALCVYRGHAIGSSVWDCRFAPSGYYFASGGTDNTARIWTTDRIVPVRALTGHLSGISCVAWHPNCNYLLTGSDDRTVRMWDVQTGRCVRLLTGSTSNLTSLEVSPNGRHAVAGDGTGNIHVWDLGTGRLVTEIRPNLPKGGAPVYSLAFSSCGSALASGGADCCVRLWDVRGSFENRSIPSYTKEDVCRTGTNGFLTEPVTEFRTKNTHIFNLMYTKRNLLMAVGRYIKSDV